MKTAEDFEADVLALVRAAREVAQYASDADSFHLKEAIRVLGEATENVDAWYEDDDPRSMGWVDDKGRP
jgi:hypothetical protein